jgi:hypothetical protein
MWLSNAGARRAIGVLFALFLVALSTSCGPPLPGMPFTGRPEFTFAPSSPTLAVTHTVGGSPCPTLVGTITVALPGQAMAAGTVTFTAPAGIRVDPPSVTLDRPGAQATVNVLFDCTVPMNITGTIDMNATLTSVPGSAPGTASVPINVTVVR